MGKFGGARQFFEKKNQELTEQNSVDALIKRAQLAELGVEATPRKQYFGGMFGGGYDYKPSQTATQVPTGFVRVGGKVVQDPTYQSPKDEAMTRAYNSRAGAGTQLTPGRQIAKDKATSDIFGAVEANKVKRTSLKKAEESLPRVPTGILGNWKIKALNAFKPDSPTLTDWQNVKAVLTDAQLLNTAKTKGAISDREMELFAKAAANDDVQSIARMKPTLERLKAAINAEESGMFGAYEKNYGENPQEWFGSESPEEGQNFNSPEEADASGLPPGSIVMVQGRKYQI